MKSNFQPPPHTHFIQPNKNKHIYCIPALQAQFQLSLHLSFTFINVIRVREISRYLTLGTVSCSLCVCVCKCTNIHRTCIYSELTSKPSQLHRDLGTQWAVKDLVTARKASRAKALLSCDGRYETPNARQCSTQVAASLEIKENNLKSQTLRISDTCFVQAHVSFLVSVSSVKHKKDTKHLRAARTFSTKR